MKVKIHSEEELQEYLDKCDFKSKRFHPWDDVYFLWTEDGQTYPVNFSEYKGYFVENGVDIRRVALTEEELREYVEEMYEEENWKLAFQYEKTLLRNGYHYTINTWQVYQIDVPAPINAELEMISEQELITWSEEHWNDERGTWC